MGICWVDCESTSLDVRTAEITEVAWAVNDETPRRLVLPHTLANADPKALHISRYWERGLGKRHDWAEPHQIATLADDLRGNTLAGSNPRYDAALLERLFGHELWPHRLLDVCAYAAGAVGWSQPAGLEMTARAFGLEPPDHSAVADLECARNVWLEARRRSLRGV